MDLPNPLGAAAAFAAFVRRQLADLPLASVWTRSDDAARQVAAVIVTAAAPFATTSYARARLLRQLHATGLLSRDESENAVSLLEIAQ